MKDESIFIENSTLTFSNPPNYGVFYFRGPDNEEYLRFEPGGKIFIKGEQVNDNEEAYKALMLWLGSCICTRCGGSCEIKKENINV